MHVTLSQSGWIGFFAFIAALMAIDLFLSHRPKGEVSLRSEIQRTLGWIAISLGFAGFIHFHFGVKPAQEFLAGYVLEYSLSIDNLFVFILVFRAFAIPPNRQRRVLFWGILGAVILRAAFIIGGVALIHRFHSISYVFGGLLLITSVKLLIDIKRDEPKTMDLDNSLILRFAKRTLPISTVQDNEHFTVRQNGRLLFTPLFLALIVIESSDVIFAIDSIPAVLGITQDTFIVFSSNLFAILGLRSLYFAIASAIEKFRFLPHALAVILAFVGAKMMLSDWIEIPIQASLGVIIGTLSVALIANFFFPKPE